MSFMDFEKQRKVSDQFFIKKKKRFRAIRKYVFSETTPQLLLAMEICQHKVKTQR